MRDSIANKSEYSLKGSLYIFPIDFHEKNRLLKLPLAFANMMVTAIISTIPAFLTVVVGKVWQEL